MKAITKRFLAVFLSLMIVIAPTIQQANAASSWSITSAVSAGSRSIVSATKSGYKSAVNIAPTAGRLALSLAKLGRGVALVHAVDKLLGGIDWVLEPENNRVKYTELGKKEWVNTQSNAKYNSAEAACRAFAAVNGSFYRAVEVNQSGTGAYCYYSSTADSPNFGSTILTMVQDPIVKYLTMEQIAAQVKKNADAGHAPSKAVTLDTATEMVIGGQFDQDLLSGAVPTSDTRPLVPAVPGNGNGNVTHGSDVGTGEDGMSGATPGQQADAAKDAADAAKKAAQAAADAAKAAADAAREAADNAADLVNSGADAAAQAAAEAAAKAAAQAAKDAAASAAAAGDKSAAQAAAAERAAAAATAAAKAAAEKAAADLAAAIAAGEQAAIDAAKAATEAAAKELAEAKEKQAAAEKAAEKAKAEAAKPFELPAFCTWAAIVCETAEWLKREPETPEITAIDTDSPIDDFDSDKSYITFTGSCPPKYTASLSIMGATAPFEFDYTPICTVMSYLKPFIVGAGYIAAAYIIAGHSRGSKD